MKRLLLAVITFFLLLNVSAQTLTITSASPNVICGNGSTDTFSYKVSGTNIPANANIVIYQSTNPSFNPYLGQGDSIAGIKGDSIKPPNSCIRMLGLFIDACNPGSSIEGQNEYMTIASGSGIKVSNLAIDFNFSNNVVSGQPANPLNADINFGSAPCSFRTLPETSLMNNLRANLPCNNTNVIAAGPNDSIPANAIILLFTSNNVQSNYNISSLCAKGFPIYVLQNNCKRVIGAFSNLGTGASNCGVGDRYKDYVVRNLATGCYDSLVYDRCHSTSGFSDGTYVVNLPDFDTLSVANGGIKNNASGGGCVGIDYTADGLNYQEIVKSSDTTFKFSISPSFCNTGFHYIKAIINPGTPQVTSNTIQYKLVCLDLTATPTTTTICSGQNAVINNSSTDANATFSWTVSGGANITGEAAGNGNQINQTLINTSAVKDSIVYSITATDDICTVNKTVKIVVNPLLPKPNLGRDTAVCGVVNIPLSTGNTNTTWFRNDIQVALNQGTITANDSGIYRAVIIGSCNTASDTIIISKVNTQPKPNLGRDTAVCGVVNIPLSTGNINTTWFRNDIQVALNQGTITANDSGTYRAVVTGTCGTASDTIIISKVNIQPKPNLGRDTAVCGVVNIPLSTGNINTTWFRNDIQVALNQGTITANDSGTYRAVVTGSCGTASDTIVISKLNTQPKPNLGRDTAICGTINIPLSTGITTTTWFRNDIQIALNQSNITANDSGTYRAVVTGSCGTASDTIIIFKLNTQPKPNLGRDTAICGVVNIPLSTGNTNTTWFRNDIQIALNQGTITANSSGTYRAVITGSCGTASDTIIITQSPNINFDFGTDNTFVCNGSSITLDASNAYDTYVWSTGSAARFITVTTPDIYWVDVFKNGCKGTDTITVNLIDVPLKPFIGNDTTFCGTFSKILTTGSNLTTWFKDGAQIAANVATINVTQTGRYIASITNSCGSVFDTIDINTANALTLNLGRDTVLCAGQTKVLNAFVAGSSITYTWNTGAATPSITVPAKFFRYIVEVSNGICTVSDSIIIDSTGAPNKPFLGNDTAFCGDFSKVLITGDNTFWSTGETGIQITVTRPDQYIAENRNVCGSAKDTIVITQFVAPIVNLGKDTTICDSIILTVGNAGFNSIFWSTGDSANSILVTNKGLYTVTVTNTNCSKTDSIDIDKDCDYDVYLPSAFSPNNDDFNDVLVPLSDVSGIIVTDFIIFNRWSEKVFESRNFSPNDKAFGWKGTYKGEPAAVDQYGYYYAVRLQDGKIKTYKGTVTIIK